MGFRALRSATRGCSPLDSRKPFEKGLTENFYFYVRDLGTFSDSKHLIFSRIYAILHIISKGFERKE